MTIRLTPLTGLFALALAGILISGGAKLSELKRSREAALPTRSEVPIVKDLTFAARQPELEILELQVKAKKLPPRLESTENYGSRFILEAKLKYRVSGRPNFRPVLKCAQITARSVSRGDFGKPSEIDIEIVPIFDESKDEGYDGTFLEASTTLEDVVESNAWGENFYRVHCGSKSGTVQVFCDKGSLYVREKQPSLQSTPNTGNPPGDQR